MKLSAKKRAGETKGQTNQIRRDGNIPAVFYSLGKPGQMIEVDGVQFAAALRQIKSGHLATTKFTLEVEGKNVEAIVKDIQYDLTSYKVIHIDFEELKKDVAVRVKVPLECVGEAECEGVKLGGFMRQVIRSVRVECLPKDIPSEFVLDIRDLKMKQSKRLSHIAMPTGVKPLATTDEVVVVIAKRLKMEEVRYLITGLGNPGKKYDDTRHNIGFRVVKALAERCGITFRPALIRARGSLGEGRVREKKAHLLLPLTYMNESGTAVRKSANYFKVPIDHLIVVTDDVDLPLGKIRLREKGGSGGHNGLKSIEAHLGTQNYTRMRIGVGGRDKGELADHVLGRFSAEEQKQLPEIVDKAIETLEIWISEGVQAASKRLTE